MILFGPILLFGILAYIAIATLALVRGMLSPLADIASIHSERKMQFFISDFYAIVFQLALVSGAFTAFDFESKVQTLPALFCVWALFALLWLIGIRMLSRAGVTKAWPRLLMLCVAVPLAHLGSFIASGLGLAFLISNPKFLPLVAVSLILLYVTCNRISEWAAKTRA